MTINDCFNAHPKTRLIHLTCSKIGRYAKVKWKNRDNSKKHKPVQTMNKHGTCLKMGYSL